MEYVNKLLKKEGASFSFTMKSKKFGIDVLDVGDLESIEVGEHPNIRTLVNRMDIAYNEKDLTNVLHSSASIFETMAKDIIGIPSIQNQTLKSFFDRYRHDSKLPDEILNYILSTYEERNSEPMAGHGGLGAPNITKEKAIILIEMTKAFIKIEYRLRTER